VPRPLRVWPRISVEDHRPIGRNDHLSPFSGRATALERFGTDLVYVIVTNSIPARELFEFSDAVDDFTKVWAFRDAIRSAHYFTMESRSIDFPWHYDLE
jgi:hypothetical protein